MVLLYWVQQTVFWTQNKRLLQVSITIRQHVNAVILYLSSIVSISFHVICRHLQNYTYSITHLLSKRNFSSAGLNTKVWKNVSEAPYIVQHREIRKYPKLRPRGLGLLKKNMMEVCGPKHEDPSSPIHIKAKPGNYTYSYNLT